MKEHEKNGRELDRGKTEEKNGNKKTDLKETNNS